MDEMKGNKNSTYLFLFIRNPSKNGKGKKHEQKFSRIIFPENEKKIRRRFQFF